MTIYSLFLKIVILSLPIITLVAIGRSSLSIFRALKAEKFKLALLSFLGIISLLGVFAIDIVIWFGYGVAHIQKDIGSDMIVLAMTGIPVYAGSYGLWRLSVYIEGRL